MKKIEDWFLDEFMPKYMFLSQFIGVIVIIAIIPFILWLYLKIELYFTLPIILISVVSIYYSAKSSRFHRRIDNLLEEEADNIEMIIKDNNRIDRDLVNHIVQVTMVKLAEEKSIKYDDYDEKEKVSKIMGEIEEVVWEKYRKFKYRKSHSN